MADPSHGAALSAVLIAQRLGLPEPTEQQRAIIESPLEPALVVAGAGSGKTETMAARVTWLVANGLVAPGAILGLTFTRKAAGELSARIFRRLSALYEAGIMPAEEDPFDTVRVATYNAFAQGVYRDNAMLLGEEPDGVLLGEAASWRLARHVVASGDDPRLVALGKSVESVTDAVLSLSRAMAENVVQPAPVAAMARRFAALADLPPGGRGLYSDVESWAATVGALDVLADLAVRYRQEKRSRGFLEYSDQIAQALRAVEAAPQVREGLRERHRVILLDEYQDTSVVQGTLLAALFGGLPVMAVGDPHQSIYGWRGASAEGLSRFGEQFGGDSVYHLTVTWRNGRRILDAANTIAAPLAATVSTPVEPLDPAPTADDMPVDSAFAQTVGEEARAVADWLADRLASADGTPPSAALLLRSRTHQQEFLDALHRRGVPFHVLGAGGLLNHPAVADLLAGLRIMADLDADESVVRLVAGARWRLGVRDIRALSDGARWLADHDRSGNPLADVVRRRLHDSVTAGEGTSLTDAVDFLRAAPARHPAATGMSTLGRRRLGEAGALFARLRARRDLGLREAVAFVRRELRIDLEYRANETLPEEPACLDAFADAIDDYLAVDDEADLRGFLRWLADAVRRDNMGPRAEEPEPGTVQVLTVHGAKGLEWDHVAVPLLNVQDFPSTGRGGSTGWLSLGELPYEFRGDGKDLPRLDWRTASSRKELVDAVQAFKEAVARRHGQEERRLAYVAVTRARHRLLLTGSFWAAGTRPRRPSVFLTDLADAGMIAPLPAEPDDAQNPSGATPDTVSWPPDPLGGRRIRLEEAARLVGAADPSAESRWSAEIDLLLAERDERVRSAALVALPFRIPASRFHDYIRTPADVAAELRRPVPPRPSNATRLGTLFHRWVEERSAVPAPPPELDGWSEAEATAPDPEERRMLDSWQKNFASSPWARLRPLEVEREIQVPFEGHLIVCKIDAVYERDGRHEIVDWKTGRLPGDDPADLSGRAFQLDLYRMAYAQWAGRDPATIDACFYFVAYDTIVRADTLRDPGELARLWRDAIHPG